MNIEPLVAAVEKLRLEVMALRESAARPTGTNPNIEEVFVAVAREFHVDADDMFTRQRWQPLVTARHVGIFFLVRRTGMSASEISRRLKLGNGTVTHAVNHVLNLMATDQEFRERVRLIENKLK